MAYPHCHKCNWTQDDFWSFKLNLKDSRPFGYNPLSLVIEDFKLWIKPRKIDMDSNWMKEHGLKGKTVFSWYLLLLDLKRHSKRIFTQHFWTEKSYMKSDHKCPKCSNHLCVD